VGAFPKFMMSCSFDSGSIVKKARAQYVKESDEYVVKEW